MISFDPANLLRVLSERGVKFVVIGGVAAVAHGSPSITRDLDICFERSHDNLQRLAGVLTTIHAWPRDMPRELPFRLDARTLELGDQFTFETDSGNLDCLGMPAGTGGFDDLARKAVDLDIGETRILVCGLDDLIRMKLAAGRPRDRAEIEILGALRDEIEEDKYP